MIWREKRARRLKRGWGDLSGPQGLADWAIRMAPHPNDSHPMGDKRRHNIGHKGQGHRVTLIGIYYVTKGHFGIFRNFLQRYFRGILQFLQTFLTGLFLTNSHFCKLFEKSDSATLNKGSSRNERPHAGQLAAGRYAWQSVQLKMGGTQLKQATNSQKG